MTAPAFAQGSAPDDETPAPAQSNPQSGDEETIVVTGRRLRGEVDTDAAPELQLDEQDIASYGASTIGDLLEALTPQTASPRGGRPVVLLNGKRVTNFRALRSIPSEAILRTDILPEQVALELGYTGDQRVVNIILKDNYSAVTLEFEPGIAPAGGRYFQEYEAALIKILPDTRINIGAEYKTADAITEADRVIIADPRTDDGIDQTPFRTLASEQESLALEGSINQFLTDDISGTLSMSLDLSQNISRLGLATASLVTASGADIRRAFPDLGALGREAESRKLEIEALVDGQLGPWRWSTNAKAAISHNETSTQRGLNSALVQQFVDGGGDPLGEIPAEFVLLSEPELGISRTRTYSGEANMVGPLFETAAGQVNLAGTAGVQRLDIESETFLSDTTVRIDRGRSETFARTNFNVPLARNGEGALGFLGSFSVNGNYSLRNISGFGQFDRYGYGANWSPADIINFSLSVSNQDGVPAIGQQGDAIITTPNVPIFDFVTGQTVFVTTLSGGNPDLLQESKEVLNAAVQLRPLKSANVSLTVNYVRDISSNPIASFPTLTPEIERAFPSRVVRNASGAIELLDLRPVNYLRERNERIRWGINAGSTRVRGRGGRRGGPRMGRRGAQEGPPQLNWRFSLYHTLYLTDRVTIRESLPVLDRLNGSATGNSGGRSRHSVEGNAGLFYDGAGGFVQLNYSSPTTVQALPGTASASDLRFGSTFKINLRAFISFDQKEKLVEQLPFLKGSRIRLAINNLTDSYQAVQDSSGLTPLRYQRGFVEPVGRSFEISFRKRF